MCNNGCLALTIQHIVPIIIQINPCLSKECKIIDVKPVE